jgi:hypothetical protein
MSYYEIVKGTPGGGTKGEKPKPKPKPRKEKDESVPE